MTNEMLRKLTIKGVGFDIPAIKAVLADKKSCELLRIAGITHQVQRGQTDKGEYLKLIGEFRAVNVVTGEHFEAGICLLPNFISDRIAGALQVSEQVEFALSIGAKSNPTSVTGYEYTCTPLVDAAPSERLHSLLEAAGMNVLALEKPKTKRAA